MPKSGGNNCCIVGCQCTSAKCRGLSFHGLPKAGVSSEKDEWRAKLILAINRVDKSFNPDNAKICSRHFTKECFSNIAGDPNDAHRRLICGSLPTLWMPVRSVENKKSTRKEPLQRELPPDIQQVVYYCFDDVQKDLCKVELPWCVTENTKDCFKVAVVDDSMVKFLVTVTRQTQLEATLHVLGISAPELTTNLENKRLHHFLSQLNDMAICSGITATALLDLAPLPTENSSGCFKHVVYRYTNDGKLVHDSCVRSSKCNLLLPNSHASSRSSMCKPCTETEIKLSTRHQTHLQKCLQPDAIKANDSLRGVAVQHMKEAFKKSRQQKICAEKELAEFTEKMRKEYVELHEKMHNGLKTVDVSSIDDPMLKLFWQEQQKAFTRKENGMRWHPMMIRLAILLHSRGKSAYETLRQTGVLRLPGASTLREYSNAVHPKAGFQVHVQKELKTAAEKLEDHQRYVVLLHDEMAIKSDLVFDNRSGELIGFVNKDTWTFEGGKEELASQALVFFVVGVNSSIKMSLGFFGTKSAAAAELFPLFWQAVGVIERTGLKVIISTCDKASQNQRLYQMHGEPNSICYKTVNFFAPDRYIYFISDPPHLMKTVRNNLCNSGSGKNTKLLWNNGHYILWDQMKILNKGGN